MIRVTIDFEGLRERLGAAAAACRDLSAPMAAIAEVVRGETLHNFDVGGAFPSVWPPSGRRIAYLVGQKRKGKVVTEKRSPKTLVGTANLRNSIHSASGADFAEVGTAVPYAGIHQFGGTTRPHVIRPRVKKALAYNGIVRRKVNHPGSVIPPRPFLPVDMHGNLSPATMTRIQMILDRHLNGPAGGVA